MELYRASVHISGLEPLSDEEGMLPAFGNAEYLSGAENMVERSPSPAHRASIPLGPPPQSRRSTVVSPSPQPIVAKTYRPPLATIYPSSLMSAATTRTLDSVHSLPFGNASSMAFLAPLATIHCGVQQWCYGWVSCDIGPPN
jgi:hypothetical protein